MTYPIWHGWTTLDNSDKCENLTKTEIFPTIASKNINGHSGIQLQRRQMAYEVKFIAIMQFDSIGALKQFAGEDNENLMFQKWPEKSCQGTIKDRSITK